MHKLHIAVLAVLLGCLSAPAAPVDNCGFEKVPRDALLALHEARGKPFTAGAVFVNGKYLKPPYVVSRYGTAIVINGHQVTGQIVPWSKFTGTKTAAPAPAAEASPEKQDAPAAEEASSLDDLFGDDEPAPAKPAAKAAAPAAAAAPSSGTAAPPPQTFAHTARTRQLLATIDKQRTAYDRALRMNNFYFFSPRYSNVGGNLRVLGSMVEKLPDALKDATSAEDLYSRMRRSGLGFVSTELCVDLFANKRTFLSLYELRSRVREEIRNRKEMSSENTSY